MVEYSSLLTTLHPMITTPWPHTPVMLALALLEEILPGHAREMALALLESGLEMLPSAIVSLINYYMQNMTKGACLYIVRRSGITDL